MSLIVEDGTGKADAESYCSVAQADAFHSVRSAGESWTDLDVDVKERCLREATDYLTQTYAGQWSGNRRTDTQALDWPRSDVAWLDAGTTGYRPDYVTPRELISACAELAFKASSSSLKADLGRQTASESVGEISVSYVVGSGRQTEYASVFGWVRPLLKAGGGLNIMRA